MKLGIHIPCWRFPDPPDPDEAPDLTEEEAAAAEAARTEAAIERQESREANNL